MRTKRQELIQEAIDHVSAMQVEGDAEPLTDDERVKMRKMIEKGFVLLELVLPEVVKIARKAWEDAAPNKPFKKAGIPRSPRTFEADRNGDEDF